MTPTKQALTAVPALLDTDQAATYLNTTARHVRRLVAEHGLPVVRLGAKRRFRPSDLDAHIEASVRYTSGAA